jgi:hypothetical protein
MKRNFKKILFSLCLFVLIVMTFSLTVFGLSPNEIKQTDPNGTGIQDIAGKILGVINAVGVVLMVLVLAVLGVKYLMGSVEEKADYKKAFVPYIVGAALIGLAPTIANIIYTFVTSAASTT